MTDHDLRRLLVRYRETMIYSDPVDPDLRKHGILRRAMIDHLVEWKPTSTTEWCRSLPDRLREQTSFYHFPKHGPAIVAIVSRHLETRQVTAGRLVGW